MDTGQNLRKDLETALSKYRINKEKVSPEDLAGKYRTAFEKLRQQILDLASEYLKQISLSGFRVRADDSSELVSQIEKSYKDNNIGKRVGRAIFKNYSIQEMEQIAAEQRGRNRVLYEEHFNHHFYLYITEPCLDPDNPQPPLVCNYLTDKCYDMSKQEWVDRDKLTQQREA